MNRHLLFWRHAEAKEGIPDLERPLTPRGIAQASHAADWLRRHAPGRLQVISSPAQRARQTAATFSNHFLICNEIGPDQSLCNQLDLIERHLRENSDSLLIVGHQPALGQVISKIVCGMSQPWSVRKNAIWWLTLRQRNGLQHALIRHVVDLPSAG